MFSRAPASDPAPDPDPPAAPGPSDPNSETADALHHEIFFELEQVEVQTEDAADTDTDTTQNTTRNTPQRTQDDHDYEQATQSNQPLETQHPQQPATTTRAQLQDTLPGTSRPKAPKRKATSTDIDSAIMQELTRMGHKDSDRDYTFAMNVYAELKHRSDATKKLIKRRILDILDDNEY